MQFSKKVFMTIKEKIIDIWGLNNLQQIPKENLPKIKLSNSTKEMLNLGLPKGELLYGVTFELQSYLLTLKEYFEKNNKFDISNADKYYRIGYVDDRSICIRIKDETIWEVDQFGDSVTYLNINLEALLKFLCIIYSEIEEKYSDDDDKNAELIATEIEKKFLVVDAKALEDENIWSFAVEEIGYGIWGLNIDS